ncbi:hypothetical protein DSLASN_34830 [Desulfoluna limicola]|uniref:HTH cro/C1-type domain-containing protein n=1 Tax=Desulfoluna limicola TaxID=2810562 RepID=A0ABN6F863_9BACT|nr:hypothetical protein [Desulfoluna limicola]BCS97851.1 hypothetical protein DSLASN_34830 [Desulfoluna limicola]
MAVWVAREEIDKLRDVRLNEKNRRVEHNIKAILDVLVDHSFSYVSLATFAGVTPAAISGWAKSNRADVAAVERMLELIFSFRIPDTGSGGQKVDTPDKAEDKFEQLQLHINGLKKLGFNVTLIPM